MKRFSVLLVVVAFLIPLVVYGLNGNFDRSSADNGLELDTPLVKTQIKDQVDVANPKDPDPTSRQRAKLFPKPEGIRGIIEKIEIEKSTIYIKDAVFFNPLKSQLDQADFIIKFQEDTVFIHNTLPVEGLGHLVPGIEIICQGVPNFSSFTMNTTQTIYSGTYYRPEDIMYVHVNGPILSVNREENSLTLHHSAVASHDIGSDTTSISIVPSSMCFRRKPSDSQALRLNTTDIPDFVKPGTHITGMVVYKFGQTKADVLDIVFFK